MKRMLRTVLLVLGLVSSGPLGHAADPIFITNPSGPDSLSGNDIKAILLGNKTKWDAGGLIKLAVLSSGSTHDAVIEQYTARSSDQFDKYWKKQVFTGKGISPDSFKTEAELAAFVAKTPGAFGYISSDTPAEGTKSIAVK